MTEPALAHNVVRLVDREGQLVGEACPGCIRKDKELNRKDAKIRELQEQEAERLGLAADAGTIRGVLQYHKQLFPGTKIITGKAAWKAVRARLADTDENSAPAFTVPHLKAAAMGLKLGRTGRMADRPHGAAWLYGDEERVQYWIGQCVTFKRDTGVSALTIVDELGKPGLERLAERCVCGHLRLDHERENPAEELFDPPCAVHGCHCTGWSEHIDSKVQRWVSDRERMDAA